MSDNPYLIVVYIISAIVGFAVIFLFGINKKPEKKQNNLFKASDKASVFPNQREKKGYSREEIKKHNKIDDLWIIVDGKVYEVTNYVDEHPGGDAIMNNAGGDATTGFKGPQHPVSVWDVLALYHIGHVEDS
jgi:cytochrome b involved in lipid metabolism